MEQKIKSIMGKISRRNQPLGTPETTRSNSEQEELIRLFNITIDMLSIADIDGCFRFVNQAWETTLGFKKEELLGKPYTDFIHPDDIASTLAEGEKLFQGMCTLYFENRYRCKDGSYKWLAWTSSPDPEKGITFSVARDITEKKRMEDELKTAYDDLEEKVKERTIDLAAAKRRLEKEILERKQAEEALSHSERRFREIADLLPTIICEMDMNRNVTYVNNIGLKIFGLSQTDFEQGINIEDIIHPESKEKMYKRLERIVRGEYLDASEYRLFRKDGSELLALVHASPINNKGNIVGIRMSVTDITERKKLERQLHQSQKMESIGTLSGGIAHDFNNILAAIIGFTEISMLDAQEGSKLQANLEEVLKAGERAKGLVLQILTFSRQAEQELKPVQVNILVREALKLLRASLPTTIDIKQDVKSASLVMGDPTQIHQILMNLCTNAGYAMQGKGGILKVSLENVEIDSDYIVTHPDLKPGTYIVLTVSDTGQGMTPRVLNQIFDPFFTTKGKGGGTGLGLSVVHGIVNSFGGTIYAYSEQGKGSSFKVILPIIERRIEMKKKEEKFVPKGTEHILFIDDEPPLIKMGKQLLESLGYEITTRTSSLEALELFKTKPDKFDLVITDMTMPNMTGDYLTEKLIAIRPDIPVILCTGFSAMITKQKALSMGIRALAMKPILKYEIAQIIRKVLDDM
ncbi:MAG: PAS domain S-box protein [Deltaproteobacteria bacterium]|nr:PAS domain S-box protein [Deltaproteobacteria bacterium]